MKGRTIMNIGWIGTGRMGYPMVSRVLKAGHSVRVWNRSVEKARPLAALGAQVVDRLESLGDLDILFTVVTNGNSLHEVCFGPSGAFADTKTKVPRILVDCSTIGVPESEVLREKLAKRQVAYLTAPLSGNPECVVAGQLSSVVSGPQEAYDEVEPLIKSYAVRGAVYVGEGDLARFCKIAHNTFLAGLMESLMEVTLLAEKAGVARHTFLEFINRSVMGSGFTQYKSAALVNLDFTPTFTVPLLLNKDLQLGLDAGRRLGVTMPIASATREILQSHIGLASQRPDAKAYLENDFAAVIETLAALSGMKLAPENVHVPNGLEVPVDSPRSG